MQSCWGLARRAARAPLSRLLHARALPRLQSTATAAAPETAAAPAPAASGVIQWSMIPTIVAVLGAVAVLAGPASFFRAELARIEGLSRALEERVAGIKETVTKEVDAKVAGIKETVTKEVDAKVAGITKEVDAKVAGMKETVTGAKETMDASTRGVVSKLEERVAGIEKAADLKVRHPRSSRCRAGAGAP